MSRSSSRAFFDDLARRRLGNDAELGLGARQRGLVVQPGLEARGLGEERPHAGIGNAKGGGLVLHGEAFAPAAQASAGITSSVRIRRLRVSSSGGIRPPGFSSAMMPSRPSSSLSWVSRATTPAAVPKATFRASTSS